MKYHTYLAVLLSLFFVFSVEAADKPLKVYILAGQSNMDGHADVRTIAAMKGDPEVADLYNEMVDKDGKPIAVDGVYIVHGDRSGKLDASFGSTQRGPKIGPEYAFGITMKKLTKEPILIIKTAWGGMNLLQQFRSPSAGPYETEADKWGNPTGHKFRQMIKAVKDVLADPGKYHPAYDPKAGYEIAGLVWFQGWNDYVNKGYYRADRTNRKSPADYSEYTRLMACFIRDARKHLSAPDMKFVIGAFGVSGDKDGNQVKLAKAQGATADLPEFKDNVGVVYTAKYWDHKLGNAAGEMKWIRKQVWHARRKSKEEQEAIRAKLIAEKLTEEELELLKIGQSNKPYHYLGSAKMYSRFGKAFAEAMIELDEN